MNGVGVGVVGVRLGGDGEERPAHRPRPDDLARVVRRQELGRGIHREHHVLGPRGAHVDRVERVEDRARVAHLDERRLARDCVAHSTPRKKPSRTGDVVLLGPSTPQTIICACGKPWLSMFISGMVPPWPMNMPTTW